MMTIMAAELYDSDILGWSEHQADLLRRVASGQRVNGVDWEHVIEEIADVGIPELNAVHSFLSQAILHLLKIHLWPGDPARMHWRLELMAFLESAARRFALSMRQRVDVSAIGAGARHRRPAVLQGPTSRMSLVPRRRSRRRPGCPSRRPDLQHPRGLLSSRNLGDGIALLAMVREGALSMTCLAARAKVVDGGPAPAMTLGNPVSSYLPTTV
jgi:hypothetical protein